jgi:hypothetical protein
METNSQGNPVNLPNLTATNFNVAAADISITADPEQTVPMLSFTGQEDAFSHEFTEGSLFVQENADRQPSGSFVSGDIHGPVVIGYGGIYNADVVAGRNITYSDDDLYMGNGNSYGEARTTAESSRKASLILPTHHPILHHIIETVSGDVTVDGTIARQVGVGTASGNVEIHETTTASMHVRTASGDTDIDHTSATGGVRIDSASGDVDIKDSAASEWNIVTASGDIKTRGVVGSINPHTASGDVDIR